MEELLEDLIYKSLSSFLLVFGELKSYENSWKMSMLYHWTGNFQEKNNEAWRSCRIFLSQKPMNLTSLLE